MNRLAPLIAALLLLAAVLRGAEPLAASATATAATPVYDEVMTALAGQPSRLPGSREWTAAAEALTRILKARGVELQRQEFSTAVPRTRACRLVVDGVEVQGVLPLAPDGVAPTTTWGRELAGGLVYLGDGSGARLAGQRIAGSIALLDLGSPAMAEVFALGARAVVFVGDEASQWAAARNLTDLPLALPRAWISRADAERAGLLAPAATERRAGLTISSAWEPAATANLWAYIPAVGGDAESKNQTIVLAAQLDTFGVVPDRSPQGRWAANCALLAETAARLRDQPAARNVLVVFLGSHYSAQEGARVLYWVVNKTKQGSREKDPLDKRAAAFKELEAELATQIPLLADPKVVEAGSAAAFELTQRLREQVVGMVNTLNYRIRTIQLERRAIPADEQPVVRQEREAGIDRRIAELSARKTTLNEFRRQLHDQRVTDPKVFNELAGTLAERIRGEQRDAGRLARETDSSLALYRVLNGQDTIAHFGLDFASASAPWLLNPFAARSMAYMGESGAGQFVKQAQAFKAVFAALPAGTLSAPLYTPDPAATYPAFNLCTPRPLSRPNSAALALGIYGAQLQTLGDPLDRDELPHSPAPDLAPLAGGFAGFVRALAAGEFPSKTGLVAANLCDERFVATYRGTWAGMQVINNVRGSTEREGPAPRAGLIVLHDSLLRSTPQPGALAGHTHGLFTLVDAGGHSFAPNIVDQWTPGMTSALGFDEEGVIDRSTVRGASGGTLARLFYGRTAGTLTTFQPNAYTGSGGVKLLSARTDAEAQQQFLEFGTDGHVFVLDHDKRLKLLYDQGLPLLGMVADPRDDRERDGRGLDNDPALLLSTDPVAQAARDLTRLNRQRMDVLRAKNLINKPVERLQADADDQLDAAGEARAAGQQALAGAHETAAAILANRAYRPLKETASDLLGAVLILLILSIPFAFAAERLALGAAGIHGQIGGFLALFCATFGVLYFTHPAFALASAPIVIFLAFVIILLAGFVIIVMMGKFRHELKALQGLASKAHGADQANSTWFAAVIIGISGMRNRPLKTGLTVATVTLLTFTILVFASFESAFGVQETYLGRSTGPDRIELHTQSFQTLPKRLLDSIERLYGDRFDVHRRGAGFRDPANQGNEKSVDNVVLNAAGGALKLDAVLAIEAAEAARLGGLFPELGAAPAGRSPLYLSTGAAASLGVSPGAELTLRGKPFTLVGVFQETALQAQQNIDGTRILPPNFDATFQMLNLPDDNAKRNALSNMDPGTFIFCQAGQVAVTTPAAYAELGMVVNVLALYPKPGADVGAAARELAPLFNGPVSATTADGAKRYFYTSVVSGSGYAELVVPLLLGGLIIFSSLLGSIVDRQKEIFTFSALGLAPRDVGMLFFAESAVIAVLGGMGGYLISQVLVKLLAFLADHGLATVPAVNFSSTSSLMTILIVMAMVLLSTIYPAIMASRSANPGVNRAWKMPKPEGDTLRFTFPFTVPERSFAGILGFIREHFDSHGDASLDVFSAKRIALTRVAGDARRLGITADIALAPFDLGVLQRFTMHTRPSDIPGIDEVVVELERRNGAPGTWLHANRVFIEDLRNQFLVWRSLPVETVEHYQATTAAELAQLPAQHQTAAPTAAPEVAHG